MSQEQKTASLKDVDAALLSHLAYVNPAGLRQIQQGIKPNEPTGFARAGIGTRGQDGDLPHLTQGQADYLNRNFELLDVKDFGDEIHAVTVRDKRSGEVTVAFPGTNPSELSDLGRGAGIVAGTELDVFDAAEKYVREIQERHNQPISVTGHSAGASVAVEMGRRLDDTIIREVVGFQAPGTVRSTDPWGSEWGGNEPQFDDLVDGKRIRTFNADGDFIGNFGARAGQHDSGDVSKGGAEKGVLEDHSLKNNLNTRVDEALGGLRGLAAEAGISDPTLDAELQRIEGLKFPSFLEQKAGKVKERGSLSGPEQKAARHGTLPQSKDAVPGKQSRASGWDKEKMASLARKLEAGQDPSGLAAGPGAAPKQAVARNLLHRPDGQDHRRTMEIRDLSELDRNAVQLLDSAGGSLGSFAELNQRREQARGAAGQRGQGGFGFAGLKNGAATAGGKPAAPGKREPFDQDAFLNTPLDRLDEAQVRHAMTQPAYYQSWRPFSREVNEHVTNWFRKAYPG